MPIVDLRVHPLFRMVRIFLMALTSRALLSHTSPLSALLINPFDLLQLLLQAPFLRFCLGQGPLLRLCFQVEAHLQPLNLWISLLLLLRNGNRLRNHCIRQAIPRTLRAGSMPIGDGPMLTTDETAESSRNLPSKPLVMLRL